MSYSRRIVLTGAAGAVTAASWRRAAGASARVGVALVGAGARGRAVAKALLDTGRADLTAICDVYDQRRQEARAALTPAGRPFETAEVGEVLARPDVQAVVIATPDHLHCDLATQALAARRHVYLEKPATHRLEEGERLIAAARRAGVVCQTGMQQRSGAHYQRAREEVFARGRLGRVVLVRATWSDLPRQRRRFEPAPRPAGLDWARFLGRAPRVPYHPMRYETWRYFRDYGNGLLADLLAHWADVAQWMMDDARPLDAVATGGIYGEHDGRENPDTVNATVQYAGWALEFESTVLPVRARASVTFVGTEGTLDLAREGYVLTPRQGAGESVKATGSLDDAHARSFLDAIASGARPSADVERGVDACRAVHLANAAFWRRRRVRFDARGAIVDDGGRA